MTTRLTFLSIYHDSYSDCVRGEVLVEHDGVRFKLTVDANERATSATVDDVSDEERTRLDGVRLTTEALIQQAGAMVAAVERTLRRSKVAVPHRVYPEQPRWDGMVHTCRAFLGTPDDVKTHNPNLGKWRAA